MNNELYECMYVWIRKVVCSRNKVNEQRTESFL